jgi:hypothetical protein
MDSPLDKIDNARRAVESAGGFALRATGRGALVLQTENARRMMQRVGRFKRDAPAPGAPEDTGQAPTGS